MPYNDIIARCRNSHAWSYQSLAIGNAPPRILLIETSGRAGSVALAEGAELLRLRQLDEGRRHARDLAPGVAGLLAEQGWTPDRLSAVVVSLGPGSYTGLRVGIMSAKIVA